MSIITDTTDYSCAVAVFLTRALAFNYLIDYHLISPYSIATESNIKLMRRKEMIASLGAFWLLNILSLLLS